MSIRTTLFSALIAASCVVSAQELNVKVEVNTPKLQTVDPKVFQTFKGAVQEFMNNQKWTDNAYEQDERINVNIQITITEEISTSKFKAEITIQATRPVYGASYETPLFTHIDRDIDVSYEQFQPFTFSKNLYTDNFTSVIAFYAYTVLGFDGDSFAPLGGEDYFKAAQDITNTVPQGAADGWAAAQSKTQRNRYWLLENILGARGRAYRNALYTYHRKALDVASTNPTALQTQALIALEEIQKVQQAYNNSMMVQVFVNTKYNEIVEVFKPASPGQRARVSQIMTVIDPANGSRYRELTMQ